MLDIERTDRMMQLIYRTLLIQEWCLKVITALLLVLIITVWWRDKR